MIHWQIALFQIVSIVYSDVPAPIKNFDTNLSTNDILGELVELKRFLNGNVNATLYINGKLVSIIEIDPSFAVEKCNLGSIFGFYGLKRRTENSYSMNNFSCIYNVPQQ